MTCVRQRVHNPGILLCYSQAPSGGFPAFNRYYEDTKTASVHLSAFAFRSASDYLGCFLFLGDRERKARPRSWILLSRCDPFRLSVEETGGSPSFPGDPITALPCSRTPGGPPRLTNAALRCCPRSSEHEGSPINKHFEAQSHGFTARCLRLKTPFLDANQGSLPVGGQPFPGGSGSRRVSIETFSCSLLLRSPFGLWFLLTSAIPVSQGFGWRQGNCFLREAPERAIGSDRRAGKWGLQRWTAK